MKIFNNNLFWLLLCILTIFLSKYIFPSSAWTVLLLYFSQIILYCFLAIAIHEYGHFFFGKLLSFKLIFVTTILGMQTPYKFYLNNPFGVFVGLTSMYKPTSRGKSTKKELVLFYIGGIIFNLIFIFLFNSISYSKELQLPFSKYIVLSNFIILFIACVPSEGSDMHRIIKVLKNDKEELHNFNIQSLQADPTTTSEDIINTLDYTSNEFINSAIDLAKIETYSRSTEELSNIREMNFTYKNEDIVWELVFFQKMFKYIETRSLTPDIEKAFNHKMLESVPIIKSISNYIASNDEQYIDEMNKYKYQLGTRNRILIVNNFLRLI